MFHLITNSVEIFAIHHVIVDEKIKSTIIQIIIFYHLDTKMLKQHY